MNKLQKILIPIDFSKVAENAVRYAAGILERQAAEVILVHVNRDEHPRSEVDIKEDFKVFQKEVLQQVNFSYNFRITKGNLFSELVKINEELAPDYIIIGTKGNRENDLSLASALIRSVHCAVIVVPEHYKNHHIKKIVFANDYQPIQDSNAIKPLWKFALDFRAKVVLLHINHKNKEVLVPDDAAESTLEYFLQSHDHEYVYISSDDVEVAINNYLHDQKGDLLVILSRDHGSNKLKSEGKLIAQLTSYAQVPILALC